MEDGKKLLWTVRLVTLDPVVAGRSCDNCEKYMWNDSDETGRMGDRILLLAGGDKWERSKGIPTPCHQCPKVPREKRTSKATRKDAIEPTARSWAILWHYRRCRAVNRFPVDAIVETHAALIDEMERSVDAARNESAASLLNLLFVKR